MGRERPPGVKSGPQRRIAPVKLSGIDTACHGHVGVGVEKVDAAGIVDAAEDDHVAVAVIDGRAGTQGLACDGRAVEILRQRLLVQCVGQGYLGEPQCAVQQRWRRG